MTRLFILLVFISVSFFVNAQSAIGAWETISKSENGDRIKQVAIYANDYYAISTYNITTGKFLKTKGGSWNLMDDTINQKVEFNSDNSELVGSASSFKVSVKENVLEIEGEDLKFNRIDKGEPGALQGAWLMSGRIRNGEIQNRDIDRPRKTMKILSGTRFQWIAYNTETKQFMGTGGGTYTTDNGEYIENIEFFSRDDSKVGASLEFNYELIDGNWHHSGLSSKGDPIHEIWTLRD
ncbi:membrane or secreted protein [Winogradskyella ursingii]|uniref:membrane or secreted protein n=1 Tax=Winogradskyella ursingii TaxID=2686079 RepID=UPI0015CA99B9|nr:membrane or secreted protein [Winogradskyella ursingii]